MNRGNRRVLIAGVVAVVLTTALAVVAPTPSTAHAEAGGMSFLLRFDPEAETWFTYPLPAEGADAQDLVAVAHGGQTEVWIAETGADRIGRLTYTDTTTYQYRAYGLAAGSEPLSLRAHQGFIWFTAPGADEVGRLDPDTAEIDTFDVGAGTYPADLTVGPGGDVWFTQMMADQVAQLVITSTTDYRVDTYSDTYLSGGQPRGIALSGSSFYVAQTANGLVSVFTPPNSWIHMPEIGLGNALEDPYAMVADSEGTVWGTERAGDSVNIYDVMSFSNITRHAVSPDGSEPTGIAVDPSDRVWFTQHAAGQIGWVTLGAKPNYHGLPQNDLEPTGIAADENGAIWVVASRRAQQIYLPLVLRRVG